jgi:putative hydrolase of the HAD superfamily
MAIHGITLDAAGTIIQVKEPVSKTYSEIANRHGIPIDAAAIEQAFRTVFPRMSPLAFGTSEGTELQRQEREWWRTVVRNCLGRFGQHQSFNRFFDEVYGHYAEADAWYVYEDVDALLTRLEAQSIPTVVVSNFDSRLHNILRAFSLHDRFREVLCSSVVGSAKPDARIFNKGCAVLQAPPQQVLHVGDDRRADYDGASKAGLRAQWLNRAPSRTRTDEEIATLKEVLLV